MRHRPRKRRTFATFYNREVSREDYLNRSRPFSVEWHPLRLRHFVVRGNILLRRPGETFRKSWLVEVDWINLHYVVSTWVRWRIREKKILWWCTQLRLPWEVVWRLYVQKQFLSLKVSWVRSTRLLLLKFYLKIST